jgi:hypothetical protein
MIKSGDTSRIELSINMIAELEVIPEVMKNLKSKFDTEFLSQMQKNEFEEGPGEEDQNEEEAATESDDKTTTIILATFGVLSIAVFTYLKFRK